MYIMHHIRKAENLDITRVRRVLVEGHKVGNPCGHVSIEPPLALTHELDEHAKLCAPVPDVVEPQHVRAAELQRVTDRVAEDR